MELVQRSARSFNQDFVILDKILSKHYFLRGNNSGYLRETRKTLPKRLESVIWNCCKGQQ